MKVIQEAMAMSIIYKRKWPKKPLKE